MKYLRLLMAVLMMAIFAAVPVMAEEKKAEAAPAAEATKAAAEATSAAAEATKAAAEAPKAEAPKAEAAPPATPAK